MKVRYVCMGKFVIQSHGRLHEWVAEQKGYFEDEGLDYEFQVKTPARWSTVQSSEEAPDDLKHGAFEAYADGRPCNVSSACHWTVNMAAAAGHGRLYGDAYSVTPSGIYVAPESDIANPEDLANVEIAVGYHSGSHYSTIQGLEKILKPDEIRLKFVGLLHDRLALLLGRKIPAANMFGSSLYLVEGLGFRKVVDTTFMIAALVTGDAEPEDVEKYFRALRRAQQDIDLRPERYTHYFLRELPEKYRDLADTRRFGPGERIVFEPYSKEIFEETHKWVMDWKLFPEDEEGKGSYEESVIRTGA